MMKELDATAFTKRHYIIIAEVIKGIRTLSDGERAIVAGNFAFAFRNNHLFDKDRFIKACGVISDKQQD